MELSLELMKAGSHQVEMSDEGLMTEDIEGCLSEVFKALKNCDLPSEEVIAWCSAMLAADLVGFIGDKELKALRKRFPGCGAISRWRGKLRVVEKWGRAVADSTGISE